MKERGDGQESQEMPFSPCSLTAFPVNGIADGGGINIVISS